MSEKPEARKVEDLAPEVETLSAEAAEAAAGGGMLLPAVQKVRAAAARITDITDGTSNTLMIGERPPGP